MLYGRKVEFRQKTLTRRSATDRRNTSVLQKLCAIPRQLKGKPIDIDDKIEPTAINNLRVNQVLSIMLLVLELI